MSLPVIVTSAAQLDLVAAAEWYETQAPESSIPVELFAEFDATLTLISQHPHVFPEFDGQIRRAILSQFPYGIYYTVEAQRVVVLYFISMAQEQRPNPC